MLLSTWMALGMTANLVTNRNASFHVVDRGLPRTTIDIPHSSPIDRRAAELLQHSIREISGAEIPIVESNQPQPGAVQIGFMKAPAGVKTDGFTVQIDGSFISIASGGGKGTIYGVVDLLERDLGCRCYSPTAFRFPKRTSIILKPKLYSDSPVNTFRCINGDFEADPDWLDWQRLESTGSTFGKGFYVHTFHRLVPPETHFNAHPEYFAVINGRRDRSQLCPSNPKNIDIASETLQAAMALEPAKQVWSVSQNDNEEYCHCADCMKVIKEEGSPAGPILRFVNAIARRFPDKTISTLAYEYSRSAPKVTRPEKNVQIMLCTIELTRSRPIETDPSCSSFRKDIVEWGKICHNIYLWDYTVDFAHQVAPFPNLQILQANLQFFGKNNAHQQFQQSNTSYGHEFSELKSYLIARLLWNPDIEVNGVTKEFLEGYYGPAASSIRAYIQELKKNLDVSGQRLDIFGSPVAHRDGMLSERAMARYNALFDRAEASVAQHPILIERVKTARLPIQYAALTIAADQVYGPRGFYEAEGDSPRLQTKMAETLEAFIRTCRANHVRSVNESNLSPTDFYDATKRLLSLEMEGNLAFRKVVQAIPAPSNKYGHGDIKLLTNGVHGSNDFHVQWLGWEGTDFDLTLDLGKGVPAKLAKVDSLNVWQSWILHPRAIDCETSLDGAEWTHTGTLVVNENQQHEQLLRTYEFNLPGSPVRYVRLKVHGTLQLPSWHSAAGGKSWVFLDEIVVR